MTGATSRPRGDGAGRSTSGSGPSRQRTNEALKALERLGMLRIERVGITILDLEKLESFGE